MNTLESGPEPLVLSARDKQLRIPGFVLTETVRPAGMILQPHYHEHANIALALEGAFEETIGARRHEVQPSSVILRPAGEKHSNRYWGAPSRSLIIEVTKERLVTIREATRVLDNAALFRTRMLSHYIRRIHREFETFDSLAPLAIEALILDVLVEGGRQAYHASRQGPKWLKDVTNLLHDELSTAWTLSELAASVAVHPAHLARVFRKQLGYTIGEYVRKLRVTEGMNLLQNTNTPISQIAVRLGFFDQSHFTHSFKLQTGMTPKAFRAKAAGSHADPD
jgi:AraC family transcriptional regulator